MKQESILARINQAGYIEIKIENTWILEHIYLAEKLLGRKLNKGEIVHHINLIKACNFLWNLMLFENQSKHKIFHNKLIRFGYFTNPMKREIFNNPIQIKLREKSIC